MKIKNLSNAKLEEIVSCFLKAFENYYVKMPTGSNYYRKRWKAAKVRYDLSYGMFEAEKLVGFIIHAVDLRNNKLVAHNIGTGVIPSHRGKKIISSIYNYALPDLIKNGVESCSLEVITQNEIAIKTYQKIGFEIVKTYKCFAGEINSSQSLDVELEEVNYHDLNWESLPNQELYSWDNHSSCLNRPIYKFYKVFYQNRLQAYFVINATNGYLAQFEVMEDYEKYWRNLFASIRQVSKHVKVINLNESLTNKIKWIENSGLKNTVNQYKMQLNIQKALIH